MLALVVHRDDRARDRESDAPRLSRIKFIVSSSWPMPSERIIFRLHRNQYLIRGNHAVHGEQAERRRKIDQNIIVAVPHAVHKFAQKIFALRNIHELHERARQDAAPTARSDNYR